MTLLKEETIESHHHLIKKENGLGFEAIPLFRIPHESIQYIKEKI